MNKLRYSIAVSLVILMFVLTSNFSFAQVGFRTDLAGESEVPPIFTESYGSALVIGNNDSLKYQINVTSLDKVTGAFLYKGDSTENGQVLVSFLNTTEPSGIIDGNLIEGEINSTSIVVPIANLSTNIASPIPTSANLTNATAATAGFGNMTNATAATAGFGNMTNATTSVEPISKLEALVDLMSQNMTYINILTSDFPDGELRGSLSSTNSTG